MNKEKGKPFLIRHPNGVVTLVPAGVGDNLLRKGRGHRRVTAMPPIETKTKKEEEKS